MPDENLLSFRAAPALLAALRARARPGADRGELSAQARECLEYHFAALAAELATVDLTEGEALLIMDSLNGVLTEPHTVSLLWANVADSIHGDGLDSKWGVDGPSLVAKLRALTYSQALAIADAATRWWHIQQDYADRSESLRVVGLLKVSRSNLEPR